jgi:hypothetical protein
MNRAGALAYLQAEYTLMAVESAQTSDDLLRSYATITDQALRAMGWPEDTLPTADVIGESVEAYLALLDYFSLAHYAKLFAARSDVSVSGITSSASQVFRQVKQLRDDAEKRCSDLGFSPTKSVAVGWFNLDFLEPDLSWGGIA